MRLYDHPLYMADVRSVAGLPLPWEKLKGRSVALTGATGLIGSFLADVLLEKNRQENLGCTVYAFGRSREGAAERFARYREGGGFVFVPCDLSDPDLSVAPAHADYVLHFASNTHPLQYAADPIGTIATNVIGLKTMLDYAVSCGASRFAFASSNEVYGENRGDTECFDEGYCGYIDCNTLRAGYPESKRCGEALCQAYRRQKGLDIVVPRFTRTYGPTMRMSDTKAVSQFIKKGLAGEDIVLKSAGGQFYSFLYAADAVSGFLTVLLRGEDGKAYNIADARSDIRLRDLAALVARQSGTRVVYEAPDALEASGYSRATKARLDGGKLTALGWRAADDIHTGMAKTLAILKNERS